MLFLLRVDGFIATIVLLISGIFGFSFAGVRTAIETTAAKQAEKEILELRDRLKNLENVQVGHLTAKSISLANNLATLAPTPDGKGARLVIGDTNDVTIELTSDPTASSQAEVLVRDQTLSSNDKGNDRRIPMNLSYKKKDHEGNATSELKAYWLVAPFGTPKSIANLK